MTWTFSSFYFFPCHPRQNHDLPRHHFQLSFPTDFNRNLAKFYAQNQEQINRFEEYHFRIQSLGC